MGITELVVIGLVVALAVYTLTIYNGLVRLKHRVRMTWSNIDVLLKQRHDELPNLVETCKGYMRHEKETFRVVIEARSRVARARQAEDVAALGPAETALRAGLGSLFALAEDYPDLKADETFRHLQSRITELENQIADRRETYNATVSSFNIRREQFPDVIVARNAGFEEADLLQFDESELENIDLTDVLD